MAYNFYLPTKIIIGKGCSGQLAGNIAKPGAKRAMCIFDQGVETAGIDVVRYNGVVPDPPFRWGG